MANKTYPVTVASGNLYGGSTGNVFYLDGAKNTTGPGTLVELLILLYDLIKAKLLTIIIR